MHTVFINTSNYSFDERIDLLDIERENGRFVALDCPLGSWMKIEEAAESTDSFGSKNSDFKAGEQYKLCAHRIGEMIDSYENLYNDYNLIVYVDLLEIEKYAELFRVGADLSLMQKTAAYTVMRNAITHFIYSTLGQELEILGRVPSESMILFEQNKIVEASGDGTQLNIEKTKYMLSLLGLPDKEKLAQLHGKNELSGKKDPLSLLDAFKNQGRAFVDGVDTQYAKEISNFISEIDEGKVTVEKACDTFASVVENLFVAERNKIFVSRFITDRRSRGSNRELNTKRQLALQMFVLECTASETTLIDQNARKAKEIGALSDEKWNTLIAYLKEKEKTYGARLYELQTPSSFAKEMSKMTPKMYPFDPDNFGLDEHGKQNGTLEFANTDEDDTKERDSEDERNIEETEEIAPVGLLDEDAKDEIRFVQKEIVQAFKLDNFEKFLKEKQKINAEARRNENAEKYKKEALKLCSLHVKYISDLQNCILDDLPGYARSVDPKLSKRKVCDSENISGSETPRVRYAKATDIPLTTLPNSSKEVSNNSYESLQNAYMNACRARKIGRTEINEQCNWFIRRVNQVTESLKKIKIVAFAMLVALVLLYAPYFIIQWESIFANAFTVISGLLSIALPVVLLFGVFTVLCIIQKKKYGKLWKEFTDKSDEMLRQNAEAVSEYVDMLCRVIPALRSCYEYKLDVSYYFECCDTAEKKRDHHIKMMLSRKRKLDSIVDGLECYTENITPSGNVSKEIDYKNAYCSTKGNRAFYSIIEEEFLKEFFYEGR